jgi:tetratricopeptide (TPR) repeat protein
MGNRDKRGCVLSLCSKARIYAYQGRLDEAITELELVRVSFLPGLKHDWEMFAEYHQSRGLVALSREETTIALYHLERARKIWQNTNRPYRRARVDEAINKIKEQFTLERLQYCPKCGKSLESLELNRLHRVCGTCKTPLFVNPKLGAAVLITHLTQRDSPK